MCTRIYCVLQCITFKIRRILMADGVILAGLLMIDVDQIEKNDERDRRPGEIRAGEPHRRKREGSIAAIEHSPGAFAT